MAKVRLDARGRKWTYGWKIDRKTKKRVYFRQPTFSAGEILHGNFVMSPYIPLMTTPHIPGITRRRARRPTWEIRFPDGSPLVAQDLGSEIRITEESFNARYVNRPAPAVDYNVTAVEANRKIQAMREQVNRSLEIPPLQEEVLSFLGMTLPVITGLVPDSILDRVEGARFFMPDHNEQALRNLDGAFEKSTNKIGFLCGHKVEDFTGCYEVQLTEVF